MSSMKTDADQAALRYAAANDAALCTIVRLDGSFSRRLGAQLAITGDGACAGSLADGCLEHELATQAGIAREEGRAKLLRYGAGSPFIDFRLPCGSGLDILVDPFPDREALARAVAMLDARNPAELVLPVHQKEMLQVRPYIPELRMLIFGESLEATELNALASLFGLATECLVPDKGLSLGLRPSLSVDAWTAIVLLFHDHEWEGPILDWALDTPAFFIGAIGGKATRELRREFLSRKGREDSEIGRIRNPVGLIPSARDARTLALSILADVVSDYERAKF